MATPSTCSSLLPPRPSPPRLSFSQYQCPGVEWRRANKGIHGRRYAHFFVQIEPSPDCTLEAGGATGHKCGANRGPRRQAHRQTNERPGWDSLISSSIGPLLSNGGINSLSCVSIEVRIMTHLQYRLRGSVCGHGQ